MFQCQTLCKNIFLNQFGNTNLTVETVKTNKIWLLSLKTSSLYYKYIS